jgi:6-phosphogluconolactonase
MTTSAPLDASSAPSSATAQPYHVLVSNAVDAEIGLYRMDRETGALSATGSVPTGSGVSALAPSADGQYVFAVTKGPEGGAAGIAVLSGAKTAQPFTLLHHTPTTHTLAYLAVDPSGLYLVGASYQYHVIVLYRVADIVNGHGDPVQVIDDIGNAHAALFAANGKDVYVAALGDNAVHTFALETYPLLALTHTGSAAFPAGFGPRHLRLSRDETRLLVLSELKGTLATVSRDPETGALGQPHLVATPAPISHLHPGAARGPAGYEGNGPARAPGELPPEDHHVAQTRAHTFAPVPDTTREADVWAADVHLSPDGRFVYTSERTTSQLLAYRHGPARSKHSDKTDADAASYAVDFMHSAHTETQPRGFRIDPQGRFLVACGERSTLLSVYRIDEKDGTLHRVAQVKGGKGANWIEILPAD